MAIPVWTTDSNLGSVFEKTNFLKQVSTTDATDVFDFVITGTEAFSGDIPEIGTMGMDINGTTVYAGSTDPGSITSRRSFYNTEVIDRVGTQFKIHTVISGVLKTDVITNGIIIGGSLPSYNITGDLLLGDAEDPTNVATVTLSAVANIDDLLTAINAVTDNTTYGIRAYKDGTNRIYLKKYGGTGQKFLYNPTGLTAGSLGAGMTSIRVEELTMGQSVFYYNTTEIVNCTNASFSTPADDLLLDFISISDSVSAISYTNIDSNIDSLWAMPRYSDVTKAELESDIDAVTGTTGVASAFVSNALELVGEQIQLDVSDNRSSTIFEVLGIDHYGSDLLKESITNNLVVNSDGVITGLLPTIDVYTTVTVTIRATSTTTDTVDRSFYFLIKSADSTKNISWTPDSLGSFDQFSISEESVTINNYETVKNNSTIVARSEKLIDFENDLCAIDNVMFARDSMAWYIDSNGLLRTVGPDEPRPYYEYDNDANILIRKGILVEPERSNAIEISEPEATNSFWIAVNGTVDAPTIDGAIPIDADNVINYGSTRPLGIWTTATTNAAHYVNLKRYNTHPNATTTKSVFIKNISNGRYVGLQGSVSNHLSDNGATFDLDTNTVTDTGANNVDAGIIPLANDWKRIWITINANSPSNDTAFVIVDQVQNGTYADTPTVNRTGGAGVWHLYGAMDEEGSFVTSYIENFSTSSAKVRSADEVYLAKDASLTYDITVADVNGTTSSTTSTGALVAVSARTNSRHISSITIDDYLNEVLLTGENLTIDNDGNISGYMPQTGTHNFDLIVKYNDKILLGPNTWSLTTVAGSLGDWNLAYDFMFDEDIRSTFTVIRNKIVDDELIYRPSDRNFGKPNMELVLSYGAESNITVATMDSLRDNFDEFPITLGDLKVISTDDYDVLYFEVSFDGADAQFTDVKFNGTVNPSTLPALRLILETTPSWPTAEDLPSWLTTWAPVVPVAYVLPGEGADIVAAYNADESLQLLRGRRISLDRFVMKSRLGYDTNINSGKINPGQFLISSDEI